MMRICCQKLVLLLIFLTFIDFEGHQFRRSADRAAEPYPAVTIAALIESLFSTFETPGADHATLSAAFRSAQLETEPVRTTVDPRIST